MRYDFIREAMKGRCYKRENGKRIAMFFFFLLILFGIWGGKKKDKIERNEQKGIQTRSTLFTKTVHPTVYFTIFHCTLLSLYSPRIKESKVNFLLPLIYPNLKSTKQYGDWKLRNPSLMKRTTLNCDMFFQHFLLISQRIRARACFDCIRSI